MWSQNRLSMAASIQEDIVMNGFLAIALAVTGIGFGYCLVAFFKRMPAAWLLDYDETEITRELLAKKALSVWPDLVLICLAEAILLPLLFYVSDHYLYAAVAALACQPLILIVVADQKTRIIPDQFLLALLPFGLAFYLIDTFNGTYGWLQGLLLRFGAAIAGSFFLWLSGFLAGKIMKKDAMGMGDIKLLFVSGLLVGLYNVPLLLVLSFITAAFVAVPMLIRMRHDPDSDSEMAFGPYIALATLLVMGFQHQLYDIWYLYLDLIAR